jgi:hypothetical protein
MTPRDPTRDEMLSLLSEQCPYADEFSTEAAVYWFAMIGTGGNRAISTRRSARRPIALGRLRGCAPTMVREIVTRNWFSRSAPTGQGSSNRQPRGPFAGPFLFQGRSQWQPPTSPPLPLP